MWVEVVAQIILGVFAPLAVMGFALTVLGVCVLVRQGQNALAAAANVGLSWSLSFMVGGIIMSLAAGAVLIGEGWAEGTGAVVAVVLINIVMQPLCLLLVWATADKLSNALRGRVTYAGRFIPPEEYDAEKYREMCRQCVSSGLSGLAFAFALSAACFYPLVKFFY